MTLSARQAALARQKRLRLKKTQRLDAVLAVAAVAFTAVAFKCDELLAALHPVTLPLPLQPMPRSPPLMLLLSTQLLRHLLL